MMKEKTMKMMIRKMSMTKWTEKVITKVMEATEAMLEQVD